MQMNKSSSPAPAPVEPPKKASPMKLDSILAAGGTGVGSLMLWLITSMQTVEHRVSEIDSTVNVLVSADGLIRPSTTAIRAEIQLQELYARIDRLERALVVRDD